MERRRIKRELQARVFHTSGHPAHGIHRHAEGFFYVVVELRPEPLLPVELEESPRLYANEARAQRKGDKRIRELLQ